MVSPYTNMLRPLQLKNLLLKNRLTASCSVQYFLQGAESYPTQQMITHVANKAKSGAAIVTVRGVAPRLGPKRVSADVGPIAHMFAFDLYDPMSQNYLSQMADAIHDHGSKACMSLGCRIFPGYDVCAGLPPRPGQSEPSKELTRDMLEEIAASYAEQAVICQSLGYDLVNMHMAYRHQTPGRIMTPLLNFRTDEFGGSFENRMRLPLMCCDAIKDACGRNFPVSVKISAEEDVNDPMAKYDSLGSAMPGKETATEGLSLEDAIAFAKLAEGKVDILQLRNGLVDPSHPIGFELEETPFLHYAEKVKSALGEESSVFIEAIGGFQTPETCEEALSSGKTDLIAMARTWISNSDYIKMVQENRTEDITPCIRCNKCHASSDSGPWLSCCSVNPYIGIEHRIIPTLPGPKKKVAVIGGGPAGMSSAIQLCDRGHEVVIFEALNELGGQLRIAQHVDFKWPVERFRKYLIKQVEKRNIEVKMGQKATPETLAQGEYDVVLAALGSDPIMPPIPGIKNSNVICAEYVFGNHNELDHDVVVVGGGEIGVETGIYLCRQGHRVTIIEMKDNIAEDSPPLHYRTMLQAAWENQEGLSTITGVRVTGITADGVEYEHKNGEKDHISCGSVVIAAGTAGRYKEAIELQKNALQFEMAGECTAPGGLNRVMRSAYYVSNRI